MQQIRNKRRLLSIIAIVLSIIMILNVPQLFTTETKADNLATSVDNSYDLADRVEDGVILHAWNWSYNNIRSQLKSIAEAGYTAVQTSPVQQPKDYSSSFETVSNEWWKLYQPVSYTISNTHWLGNKAELAQLCKEAEEDYGIKIIVDIVANHLGNNGNNGELSSEVKNYESEVYYNSSRYVHPWVKCNDDSAYNVCYGNIGEPDINTADEYIQGRVISLLKECIDCGVDGFRFDAAKHIETPSDGSIASNFWPNVINTANDYSVQKTGNKLYCYGEILNTVGGGRSFSSYTNYINVTDNKASDYTTAQVTNQNANGASSSYYNSQLQAKYLVLWAESHDTYIGDSGSGGYKNTSGISVSNINKSWAICASRADAQALYFVRPGNAKMGEIGTTNWKDKEVVAVNKFHNKFAGSLEYLGYNNSLVMVERYYANNVKAGGAVIVNVSGTSKSAVGLKCNKIANGNYVDQLSGNTFTVSGGYITSGNVGDTGIAVLYSSEDSKPANKISQKGGEFSTDKLELTLGLENADSGTYQIGSGEIKTYTGTIKFYIGEELKHNETVTVKLTASKGTNKTEAEYTFKKIDPNTMSNIYFDSSACSWFGNANAVPVIKFNSSDTYIKMTEFTNTNNQTLYYAKKPVNATSMTIGRMVTDGTVYNEITSSIAGNSDLLTSNSDWNLGGSWSIYTGSKPDEETTDITTEETTTGETEVPTSRLFYFDSSACSWFENNSAVAVIKEDSGNYNEMKVFTNTDNKTLYYYEIRENTNQITIGRKISNGNIYNEITITINSSTDFLVSNSDWNNGGNLSVYTGSKPGEETTTTEETTSQSETMNIYFTNNYNWSNVYIYYWGSESSTVSWPGVQMKYDKINEYSQSVYMAEIPNDVTGIIFTNGSGNQTVDIIDGYSDCMGYYVSGTSGSKLSVGTYIYK